MRLKKDVVFCFRVDEEFDRVLRDYASLQGVSAAFVVRRVLRSYLIQRGVLKVDKK